MVARYINYSNHTIQFGGKNSAKKIIFAVDVNISYHGQQVL
jgi:hypothetical protein